MEVPNKSVFSNIIDYLHLLLRYILSGFVSIVVLMFVNYQANVKFQQMWIQSGWSVIILAGVAGILIYTIHLALFDKYFYRLSIYDFKSSRKLPSIISQEISLHTKDYLEQKSKNDLKTERTLNILFALVSQTYLRKNSADESVRRIQHDMETRFALLTFLYCSFYSLVFIPLAFFIFKKSFTGHFISTDRCYLSIFAGLLVLIAAINFNFRITRREMWVVKHYPQYCKKPVPVTFTLTGKPTAQEVYLIGDFSNWDKIPDYALTKEGNDWKLSADFPSGRIFYQFLVDDEKINDPANAKPNDIISVKYV